MLNNAFEIIEGLEGNEDALTKAMEHIDQAIAIIEKYAAE